MSLARVQILPSTQGQVNVTGEPVRTAISGRNISGLYTLTISASNFKGRVYIEGSVAADPGDDDWFAIDLAATTPYVQFPLKYDDRGADILGYTFKANISWLRARIDRDYLHLENLTKQDLAIYGHIDSVIVVMMGF